MKTFAKSLILASATLAMAGVSVAATIPISATATYGSPLVNSGQTTAVWVSLASLASTLSTTITPGTTQLNFFATGGICFNPGGPPCSVDVPVGSITNPIIGGFTATSGSTTFLSTGLAQFNTISSGDWSNDPANDFIVTAGGTGLVTVPGTAAWVVFVFRDQYYGDNVDLSPVDFGVNVTASGGGGGVPEPATYTMMLMGLGAVAAFKRYRRS